MRSHWRIIQTDTVKLFVSGSIVDSQLFKLVAIYLTFFTIHHTLRLLILSCTVLYYGDYLPSNFIFIGIQPY